MQGSTTASFHVHCHSFFTHRYINGLYAVYTNKQKRNKVLPTTGHEGPEVEYRCIPTLSLTSALDGDGGKGHDPAALHPRKDAVPVVQQDGWAPGPGWTGAENLSPHRDSIPGPSRPYIVAIQTELSRPTTLSLEQQMKTVSSLSSLRSSPQCHTDTVHWRHGHFQIFYVTWEIFRIKNSFYTYLLTPRSRVLLEKLTGLQLVKKFPVFYGTRRFITALTSFRHLSLSWASPNQSTYPHPTSWRSILILSTHPHLGLPSRLFPSGFPTKILYAPLSSPIRATCPAHLILLDFITRTILGEQYRSTYFNY